MLNNPPTKGGDPKFQGRDWKTIRLGEIVDPELVRFAEYSTSVEDATSVRNFLTIKIETAADQSSYS